MNSNTKNATALDLINRWNAFWAPDFQADDALDSVEIAFFRYYGKRALDLKEVEPSGTLGLIYLKVAVGQMLARHHHDILEIALRLRLVDEVRDLVKCLFQDDSLLAQERELLIRISNEIGWMAGISLLADNPGPEELERALQDLDSVVELLDALRSESYRRGCQNGKELRLHSTVQLFRTVNDCVEALEEADDGIYLAYVDNQGNSSLGFYVKAGDNLCALIDQHEGPKPQLIGYKMPEELYDFVWSYWDHNGDAAYTKQVISRKWLSIGRLNLRLRTQLLWAAWMLGKKAITE
jgi:hypothetical protein